MQKYIFIFISFVTPVFAFAQTSEVPCSQSLTNLQGLSGFAVCFINTSVIPLLIGAALVLFIWGVIKYVLNSSKTTEREEGRKFILWGIIALFVIISIWGIISVLTNTFGLTGPVLIPQLES